MFETSDENPANQTNKSRSAKDRFATHRILALSDGVIAIVMTILVLDLKIARPEGVLTNEVLLKELSQNILAFESFAISFFVVGIFWITHHEQYHYIIKTNKRILWINLLFLLLISIIPFLTSLMNIFENSSLAVSLFGTNVVFIKMVQYANWRYAVINKRLVSSDLDNQTINKIAGRMILSIIVHIAAVFAAFINTHLCFAMYLLFPIFYGLHDIYKKSHQ